MRRGWRRARATLAGGSWTHQVSRSKRASLRWLVLDGIFANAGNTIIQTYQAIYLQALGASRSEIGTMGAITNLTLPLAMLPGAALANRSKSHKRVVVDSGVVGTLMLAGVVWLPQISTRIPMIPLGIGFLTVYYFFMYLLNPAWTAMLGETVPMQWRGRYFSTRNILMGIAAFLIVLGVGRLADAIGVPAGYQVAFGIALVTKLIAAYAFSRIREPRRRAPRQAKKQQSSSSLWEKLRAHSGFLVFCAIAALWNFGLQISGPFFYIYLVEEAQASATAVGLISATGTLAALPGQRIFGLWNDRKGSPWVQRLTGFIVPAVPLVWGFVTHPWQAYPLNAVSGFAWAGYNLASFNLLLEKTPDEQRPTFVALYQMIVGLGMAGGAFLGGWVAQTQGYRFTFILSAGLRWLGAALFALFIARTRPLPHLPQPRLPALRWPDFHPLESMTHWIKRHQPTWLSGWFEAPRPDESDSAEQLEEEKDYECKS